MEKELVVW